MPAPIQMETEGVRYLDPAEGEPEDMFRLRLGSIFKRYPELTRLYLALYDTVDNPEVGMTLCIGGDCDRKEQVVGDVAALFAEMFDAKSRLEIQFLDNEEDEAILVRVCQPFLVRAVAVPRG